MKHRHDLNLHEITLESDSVLDLVVLEDVRLATVSVLKFKSAADVKFMFSLDEDRVHALNEEPRLLVFLSIPYCVEVLVINKNLVRKRPQPFFFGSTKHVNKFHLITTDLKDFVLS